jgi:hypothetical protein
MACCRMVKLRRGLLLWPLVGPPRATARRASLASTEVSKNRNHGSNASSLRQCPPVADEDPENIRTTSMMEDCHARALTPLRKSSIAVLSARLDSSRPFVRTWRGPFLAAPIPLKYRRAPQGFFSRFVATSLSGWFHFSSNAHRPISTGGSTTNKTALEVRNNWEGA